MPISLGSRRWKFRKSCGTSGKRRQPLRQESEKPDVNHGDIVNRASKLYQLGQISKEEYMMIVEADLKCRNQIVHGVRECHVKLPPATRDIDLDPITLEALGDRKFVYSTAVGSQIQYNIDSLVRYLTTTRDFRDPVTRIPYSLNDILRLDKESRSAVRTAHNGKPFDLLGMFTDQTEKADDITTRHRLQEIQSLETCLGEMITDMLKVIEKKFSPSDAELRLSILFSEFEGPYAYMKSLDTETAYADLLSWISFLRGPPRRPTICSNGSLDLAVSFLRGLITSSDKNKIRELRGEEDVGNTAVANRVGSE